MRRIVGTLVVLALALGTGCSESSDTPAGAAGGSTTVQARSLAAVWADVLTQRDRIHEAVSKGTDMWHEDCAQVSAATASLDSLAVELGKSVAVLPEGEARRTGVELLLGYLQATTSTMRAAAIEEQVGSLPGMMIGLDALLQGIESHLTPEELGSQSVVTRPGFNPVRPPPPPSPI
jgi:hypothetical protein